MANKATASIPASPRTVRVFMWNVSPSAADFLFDLSNVVLIIGAAAVLFGTIGSIKMGAAKEYFSNIRISDNERETAKANERAEKLANETEQLRAENLALEKAVSPRKLEQALTGKELSEFSDMQVSIVSPSDLEPRNTAGQIKFMLVAVAKWKEFQGNLPPPRAFRDGVIVSGTTAGVHKERVREAVKKLLSVLNANGIDAKSGPPISVEELSNVISVEVGLRPLPAALQQKPEGGAWGGNVLQ
jgi:hypothetical protein